MGRTVPLYLHHYLIQLALGVALAAALSQPATGQETASIRTTVKVIERTLFVGGKGLETAVARMGGDVLRSRTPAVQLLPSESAIATVRVERVPVDSMSRPLGRRRQRVTPLPRPAPRLRITVSYTAN